MPLSASRLAAIALMAALIPSPSRAVELADGKLSVGGNASWAFLKTDANSYIDADSDGEWTTAMFDLMAIAKPTEDIVLSAQVGFEPADLDAESGAELEWAFGEYRVSDLLRLRAGKVKQPFGNYAELQFVGVARPFYDLPTSVYGPANVTASSYSGVGVTGEWLAESGFGMQYDVYGGALALEAYEPWKVPNPLPLDFAGVEVEQEVVENLVGGRLSLATPWEITLRLSGFGGKADKDEGDLTYFVYGASALHRGEKLWASIEAFQSVERGFENQLSAYAEAAYFVMPKAQVALRYEMTRLDLEDEATANVRLGLRSHDEVAVGLNWWFTPQVVAKASVHQIWGNRFASASHDDPLADPDGSTLLVVAGTQFTF
jgi:hypothetical protein